MKNKMTEEFQKVIDGWRRKGTGTDLAPAYNDDADSLQEILNLLSKGSVDKVIKAWKKAWSLDTIVRDLIPDKAWNYMKVIWDLDK